MLNDLDGLG